MDFKAFLQNTAIMWKNFLANDKARAINMKHNYFNETTTIAASRWKNSAKFDGPRESNPNYLAFWEIFGKLLPFHSRIFLCI